MGDRIEDLIRWQQQPDGSVLPVPAPRLIGYGDPCPGCGVPLHPLNLRPRATDPAIGECRGCGFAPNVDEAMP